MKRFMRARMDSFIPVHLLLPQFETEREMIKENNVRIDALRKTNGDKFFYLAEKLSECSEENPCFSFACPECIRRFRLKKISQLAFLCEDYCRWSMVTIVFFDEMVRDINDLNVFKIKNRLRKQLERAMIDDIVIGFIEVDFQVIYQRWVPHFHLLISTRDTDDTKWKVFSARFNEQVKQNHIEIVKYMPIKFDDLDDPLKQIAYICKFMWRRIETIYDRKRGKRKRKYYRLHRLQFANSLTKLDEFKLSDLEFMYNIRQYGCTLKEYVRDKK